MPKSKSASSSSTGDEKKSNGRRKKTGPKAKQTASTSANTNGAAHREDQSGLELLQTQRQEIRAHIEGLSDFKPDKQHIDHLKQLFVAWSKYATLADEIVLPAFEEAGVEVERVHELHVEHDLISVLMSDLMDDSPDEQMFAPKLRVLRARLASMIDSEEGKTKGLFAKAKGTELNLEELGHELKETMSSSWFKAEELVSDFKPRHLRGTGGRNYNKEQMPMRGQDRDRDEYGRFTSDDDRGGSHRGSRGMRGGYDDDRRQSHRSRSQDDDDYGRGGRSQGGRSSSSRYEDDDRGGYRSQSGGGRGRSESSGQGRGGRRTGGWFGDSEGHSEASRRGWENPDHGESGWFGDREGHSEASRRGWRNPDHGESGWFGDSEGHSRAAQRGWDNPNHGESGWFGDPEGHSEASRRGWEGRRRDDDDDYRSRRSGGSSGRSRGGQGRSRGYDYED